MDAAVKSHDDKVQMIDSSIVHVHQPASGIKKRRSLRGPKPRRPHHEDPRARRCGGQPLRLIITPGEAPDVTRAEAALDGFEKRAVVLADKGHDADRCAQIRAQGAVPRILNESNRKKRFLWKKIPLSTRQGEKLSGFDASP